MHFFTEKLACGKELCYGLAVLEESAAARLRGIPCSLTKSPEHSGLEMVDRGWSKVESSEFRLGPENFRGQTVPKPESTGCDTL